MERTPLVLLLLVTAAGVFSLAARREAASPVEADAVPVRGDVETSQPGRLKALVPLVPLAALLAAAGLRLCGIQLDHEPSNSALYTFFPGYLVGAALMAGSLLAAATGRSGMRGTTGAFFEGAGQGYASVLLLVAAASAFAAGAQLLSLPQVVVTFLLHAGSGTFLAPVAAALSLLLSVLTGSSGLARQIGGLLVPPTATPAPWLGFT